jgi:CheY-like chemotaxis protein
MPREAFKAELYWPPTASSAVSCLPSGVPPTKVSRTGARIGQDSGEAPDCIVRPSISSGHPPLNPSSTIPAHRAAACPHSPIVIIAEPDPLIRNVLRVEFTHWDYVVRLAAAGQEAEDYAAHAVAHLIVLDAKLQLGAYDACARIRLQPEYAARPIVLTINMPSQTSTLMAHTSDFDPRLDK